MSSQTVDALVGLGASLGDRRASIRLAVAALHADAHTRVVRLSRLVWSRGIGPARGPFLNGVVRISTRHEPLALLTLCKAIERRLKRRPSRRWGDRTIDLDVLTWGAARIELRELTVPHREMLQRPFVVLPAQEVGLGLVHAGTQLPLRQLPRPAGMRVWWAAGVGGRLAGLRRVRYGPAAEAVPATGPNPLGDSP